MTKWLNLVSYKKTILLGINGLRYLPLRVLKYYSFSLSLKSFIVGFLMHLTLYFNKNKILNFCDF